MNAHATRNADGSYFLEVEGFPHFAAPSALALALRLSVLHGAGHITEVEALECLQEQPIMSEATPNYELTPGLHAGVPFNEYLAWDAASNSRLMDTDVSPAHCAYRIEHGGDEETAYMRIGSADHCALLEPDEFENRFAKRPHMVHPDTGKLRNTNYGPLKEAIADLELDGFSVLTADEFDHASTVRDVCSRHSGARKLIQSMTQTELSAIAHVEDAKGRPVRTKARADFVCEEFGILGEVKTTTDLSDRALAKKMADLQYHRGIALYSDVLSEAGLDLPLSVFLWINTSKTATPDQMIRTTSVRTSALVLGRLQYQRSLAVYGDCVESGEWPGADDSILEIDLPGWFYRQSEKELSE